jgi:hypothetical protein
METPSFIAKRRNDFRNWLEKNNNKEFRKGNKLYG